MPDTRRKSLPHSGIFPNGVHASSVIQLIVDYDQAAAIRDVAEYFELTVEDVAAALSWWATQVAYAEGHVKP